MIDTKRLELMNEGTQELEVWLLDILREGIAILEEAPADYWEELAARMVDAKLGGIARRIRTWPAIIAQKEGPRRLIEEIADLYLFIQAFQRIGQLSPTRQIDLLTTAGVTQKKENIKAEKAIEDHWLVIGQYRGEEENLKYRRTWLLGETTRKAALLLDFAWGRNDFTEHWITGSVFYGSIVYYPSNYPQRALVKSFESSNRDYEMPFGFADFNVMLLEYAKALADNPWLFSFPCLLNQCRPAFDGQNWILVDKTKQNISLAGSPNGYWKLLALSAGKALNLFGQWENNQLLPLSTWRNDQLIALTK